MRYLRVLSAVVVLAACAGAGAGSRGTFEVTGTIRHSDLEGGVYSIEAKDGTRYEPQELPQAFQRDGMRVRVTLKRRDDLASVHQFGPLVEVVRIAADSSR